jgi:hypothetical protein
MLQVRSVHFGSFCAAGEERSFFTTPRSIMTPVMAQTELYGGIRMLWVHVVSSELAYIAVHGFNLDEFRRENFQLHCHCNYTLRGFSESRSQNYIHEYMKHSCWHIRCPTIPCPCFQPHSEHVLLHGGHESCTTIPCTSGLDPGYSPHEYLFITNKQHLLNFIFEFPCITSL